MPTKEEITKFSLKIEHLTIEKNISYMEAVLFHCETTGIELELGAKLISGVLKAKIQIEAESLNYLPKSNTIKLPV